jgi:hypothetical protein
VEARCLAGEALPLLMGLGRLLEKVENEQQIYPKVKELIKMARARVERFTTEGKRPRARLIIEADGAKAEYSIRLDKNNTVRLHFVTTDREEAERGRRC